MSTDEVSRERPGAQEQMAQLALLVDSVSDYAIFLLSPDGRVRTWNRGAERIKGYTAEQIIGRHFSTFYTDEDRLRDHPGDLLQVARRDGRAEEEGWRVRRDGSRFWASVVITALHDETGRISGFGKVTRDLTRRRLEEEELRASTERLRAANIELDQFRQLVLSVSDYAIYLIDPEGLVATWNAGAEHLKGYSAAEIIGEHFSTFYTEEDRARDHAAFELRVAEREGSYQEEGWRVRKDGSTFWASVTITAVRDDDGKLVGFAKITRDLTDRREAEEAQREAAEQLRQVNEELDRFASVAAHDLSDPLRTISGFAELLEREEIPPAGAEYVGHIVQTAERMTRLLNNLLEFARSGRSTDHVEAVELAPAVQRVLASLAAAVGERAARVTLAIPAEAVVGAGRDDVELVVQNLIANALKFGPPDDPVVEVAARPETDGWRLEVRDNGVGLAPEDQRRIFTPFERAHAGLSQGGTGLGLAICERLVHRYGGQIGVESELGQGAMFWVTLPSPDATA